MKNLVKTKKYLEWVPTIKTGSDILPGESGSDVIFKVHPYETGLKDLNDYKSKSIEIIIPMRYLDSSYDCCYRVIYYDKKTQKITMSPLSVYGDTVTAPRIKYKIRKGEVFITNLELV